MTTDTSEQGLERLICIALTGDPCEQVRISDRTARKSYTVAPREFDGRLIHKLANPITSFGEIKLELYLDDPWSGRGVGLYRNGTCVGELTAFDGFQEGPWRSGYLDGVVDAPFINLTPGTRTGGFTTTPLRRCAMGSGLARIVGRRGGRESCVPSDLSGPVRPAGGRRGDLRLGPLSRVAACSPTRMPRSSTSKPPTSLAW